MQRDGTMHPYPKQIFTLQQQIQSYVDAGMVIEPNDSAEDVLTRIGYYRLRGFCFHLYDNSTKQYASGTKFSDVVSLYNFDMALSHLLFGMLTAIEVALRARLNEALLTFGDALILTDPTPFKDKALYWKNMSAIASEIARSNDVFIKHNFDNHNGQIPIWAVVETLSFGTLSKLIKNLDTASGPAFSTLARFYQYKTANGNTAAPSQKMLSSWIQSVSVLRNICAHNGRIYNRAINTTPEILAVDRITPQPKYNGLYQLMLAMKYLRPNDRVWSDFAAQFKQLKTKYDAVIDLNRINFPTDWEAHFTV